MLGVCVFFLPAIAVHFLRIGSLNIMVAKTLLVSSLLEFVSIIIFINSCTARVAILTAKKGRNLNVAHSTLFMGIFHIEHIMLNMPKSFT